MGDVVVIKSPGQAKNLFVPIRLRIFYLLREREMTNKQLADVLRESPQHAHYHVRAMKKAGLIKLARERRRGGITEKFYRAAGRDIVIGAGVRGSGGIDELWLRALGSLGGTMIRDSVVLAGRENLPREKRLWFEGLHLAPRDVGELISRIEKLVAGFGARKGPPAKFLCAIYPNVEAADAAERAEASPRKPALIGRKRRP